MFALSSFTPDTLLPFACYRTPRRDLRGFVRGGPETPSTLAHFYYSERARDIDEDLRREILEMPSATEARKAAQRLEASPDWTEARLPLVHCALWMQFNSVPGLAEALLAGNIPIGPGRALGAGWESRRRGDDRWRQAVHKVAARYVGSTRPSPMHLLATGDPDLFNPFLFSSRLAVLLGGKVPSSVVIGCRSGVDASAELWAMQHHIPVRHHPLRVSPNKPTDPAAMASFVGYATHALILSRGEDRTCLAILELLQAKGIPTRYVRLDQDGRPIPKAPARRPGRA